MIRHTTLNSTREKSTNRSPTPPPSPSHSSVSRSDSESSAYSDTDMEAYLSTLNGSEKESYKDNYRNIPVEQCPSFVSVNDGETYYIYVDPAAFRQVQHTNEFKNAVNKAIQGECFGDTGIKRFGGYNDRVFEIKPSGRIDERLLGLCVKDFNGGTLVVLNQYFSKHAENNDTARRNLQKISESYDHSPDTAVVNPTSICHQTRQKE